MYVHYNVRNYNPSVHFGRRPILKMAPSSVQVNVDEDCTASYVSVEKCLKLPESRFLCEVNFANYLPKYELDRVCSIHYSRNFYKEKCHEAFIIICKIFNK